MRQRPRRGEAGVIVIEAMVATLIIAALAGVLFETIQARAAEARSLAQRRMAMLVAQSRLAASELRADDVPGVLDGTDDGFAWRVRADPFQADEPSAAGTLAIVSVSVGDIGAPGRPLARLRSLRLVR